MERKKRLDRAKADHYSVLMRPHIGVSSLPCCGLLEDLKIIVLIAFKLLPCNLELTHRRIVREYHSYALGFQKS